MRGSSSFAVTVLAVATLPVIALLLGGPLRAVLADLPLGRGAAIASLWTVLAVLTLVIGAAWLAAIPLTAAAGRRRPALLVAFLEQGVRVALVGLAVLVACEAVLATGIFLILERLFFGQAYPGSAAITLIGGFAGVFYLGRAAVIYPGTTHELTAVEIDPHAEPALWALIRSLAARLTLSPPDHALVGPELDFFVGAAPLRIDQRTVAGTSLYLSWPLLRLLSRDQAEAVIAHALAHLAGGHVDTGRRLDRGFRRLQEAGLRLDTEVMDNPAARIGTLPAAIWLRQAIAALHTPATAVQRPHEFESDRRAADVVGADALLAGALMLTANAHLLAPLWTHLSTDPRAIRGAGGALPTEPFAAAVSAWLRSEDLDELIAADAQDSTHPPLGERLRAIGVEPHAPSVADPPATDALLTDGRVIGSTLDRLIRAGPRLTRDDVVNPLRLEVGLAGTLAVMGVFGSIALLAAMSGNELGNEANATVWAMILVGVVGFAGLVYLGLQQEIVFDDVGVSATGWFRRMLGRRSRRLAWGSIRRATVGHVRSIRITTDGRPTELHGTWLNDRDVRRVVEGLRSHGVPVRFKLGAGGFDDERRVVVWLAGDRFVVPTLRRTDEGGIIETGPVQEIPLDPEPLLAALTRALAAPLKAVGPRSRPVDVHGGLPDPRRVTITGSTKLSTIRIDGFEDVWWEEGPPDVAATVLLLFDVFELEVRDDADAIADGPDV